MIVTAILALVWMLAIGPQNGVGLALGAAAGWLLLRLCWRGPREGKSRQQLGRPGGAINPLRRAWLAVLLLLYFVSELVKSNLKMAYLSVAPLSASNPGVLTVPLEELTDAEATILACMVTLTPGTLSLDISPDRRRLLVHFMDLGDAAERRREIKEGFERRIIEVLR